MGKQNDGGSKIKHPQPGRSSNVSVKASKVEEVVPVDDVNPFVIAVTPTQSSSKAADIR